MEAELLLRSLLKMDRTSFYKNLKEEVREDIFPQYKSLLAKRATGFPLQYIIQYVEFFSVYIKVLPGVFIPRPETEILVEEVLRIANKRDSTSLWILDLGTGTGAILLSILKKLKGARGVGIDINPLSVSLAYRNAVLNKLENRAIFVEGDIFSPEQFTISQKFDIIVANPPYISDAEIRDLQPEVLHEPFSALEGGKNGLRYYPHIFIWGIEYVKKGGFLAFEMGKGQWPEIRSIAQDYGFRNFYVREDLNGIERIGIIWKEEN